MSARIISICNNKGGVGKTTTAHNIGAFLSALGKKTLLIDLDPQANATLALGLDPQTIESGVYHMLTGGILPEEAVRKTNIFGFDFIPSSLDLAAATVELVDIKDREYLLEKALKRLSSHYDFIFIDSPPSLDILTVNSIVGAKEIIIPIQCEYFALQGLSQLLSTIDLVSNNLGRRPEFIGALLTMYDRRNRLSREIAKIIRRDFPGHVFDAVIPRNITLAEAPGKRKTILEFAPLSQGAKAYRQLAQELINRKTEP